MSGSHGGAVIDPGMMFRLTTVITLTGGTLFLMWLGEQITQRGVGQGTSLIIFAGIVAELPRWVIRSEEHTSELQSLMRISYAVFCSKKIKHNRPNPRSKPHLHPPKLTQIPSLLNTTRSTSTS